MAPTVADTLLVKLIPKIIIDPIVVVMVDDPPTIVETITSVVIADGVVIVMVDEYVSYGPVGVAASLVAAVGPDKTNLPSELDLELDLEPELDSAFAAITKRTLYGKSRKKNMAALLKALSLS